MMNSCASVKIEQNHNELMCYCKDRAKTMNSCATVKIEQNHDELMCYCKD